MLTLTEAENILQSSKIDLNSIDRLAEALVTTSENASLITDAKTADAVWTVLTEAARSGTISRNLGGGDVAKFVEDAFQKIRKRLQVQLGTIQWNYDEVVDFDVNVSKVNKSSLHGDQSSHRTFLNLKLLPAGATEVRTLSVDFDEAQLEDFIWKLQEAATMKDRIQKRV